MSFRGLAALGLLIVAPLSMCGPRKAAGVADPGPGGKAKPCLILHDWFGKSPVASPSYVRDHLDFLESLPFDGIALYLRSPDLSVNITAAIMSDATLSVDQIVRLLQPVQRLPTKTLLHNFAAVLNRNPPDLFDDWSGIVRNFAALAEAARQTGLEGIYFDNEQYGVRWADYPSGVAYPGKSLAEYEDQARLRGRQVMEAMCKVFPELVLVTLHGPYISEPKSPSPPFPSWWVKSRLLGPFFVGGVEGAGPLAKCVDGGELYELRTPEEFRASARFRKERLASEDLKSTFMTPEARRKWPTTVETAFGIYDQPFRGKDMSPAILQACLSEAIQVTDRYVWLYVEGPSFLRPPDEKGAAEEWREELREGKARGLLLRERS